MSNWKENLVVIIILLILAASIIYDQEQKPRVVIYDCSISEISPDYPPEVKEACRKIRASYYKNNI